MGTVRALIRMIGSTACARPGGLAITCRPVRRGIC